MVLLAKWILENKSKARVVIVTDRDELDKQIEGVFTEAGEPIKRTTSGRDLMSQLGHPRRRIAPYIARSCQLIRNGLLRHRCGVGVDALERIRSFHVVSNILIGFVADSFNDTTHFYQAHFCRTPNLTIEPLQTLNKIIVTQPRLTQLQAWFYAGPNPSNFRHRHPVSPNVFKARKKVFKFILSAT